MVQRFAKKSGEDSVASQGAASETIAGLLDRLDAHPEDASSWFELAEWLERLGRAGQAADALAQLAHLEIEAGHLTAALDYLRRSIELDPQRAESHYELAKTHHQLGRFAEAFEAYSRAYEHFKSRQRPERSKDVLESMIRLKPDDIELHLKRARQLEKDGEFKDALELYRRCADELERSGSTEEFLEITEHMLELAPEQPSLRAKVVDTLLGESQAFLNYGLAERAHKALRRALNHAPESLEAHLRLALLHERQRQPMAFLDTVYDMARRAKGGRGIAAKLLHQARQWLDNDKLIDDLAETLEIDLSDMTQELPPCAPDNGEAGLGDEKTAPRDTSSPTFAQESTREHGLLVGGAGKAQNLLALLQSIERCEEPSQLLIEDGDGNTVARMRAFDGRLELGVCIDGEVYADKPLERVSAELAKRLTQADEGDHLSASNTSTGERSQLYRLTARALVELATRAESQHFCLRSRCIDEDEIDRLSFSPFALAMRAAGYMHSNSNNIAARVYDEMIDSSDEAWLLVDPQDDSKICLPLRTVSSSPLTLTEVRTLGRKSHEILTYNRRFHDIVGGHDVISTSFSMSDGLWTAISSGAHVALVRNEPVKIGTALSKARRATEPTKSAENA
ncbi:MAG: tetratricopeptide repeat protein [Persicimonas sp.]